MGRVWLGRDRISEDGVGEGVGVDRGGAQEGTFG